MSQTHNRFKKSAEKILSAKSIILTTHKMCDGDGLGSLLAFYHALRKLKKQVRGITVDKVSEKYHFLSPEEHTERFDQLKTAIEPSDLALVFDTNDSRRIQPLYEELKHKCRNIMYIDHHPVLETGPKPSSDSIVDPSSASAGQICYFLLKEMGVSMDRPIATALYVSIVFDTQRFCFIKNSHISHSICADLCQYVENNESIYRTLFGVSSIEKMNFISKVISQVEYFHENKVALIEISKQDLDRSKLSIEDACDVLDMTLEVQSTLFSVLIVTIEKNKYKLSFRSKDWDVSKLAEQFNGGGHKNSSGAVLSHYLKNPKKEILQAITKVLSRP